MSSRQLRKLFGTGPSILKVEDSSDSDVPISQKDKLNPFAGLEVSTSGSDAEHEADTSPSATPTSKENKTKKKVKKNKKKSNKSKNETGEDIDHIVEEVNKILGVPNTYESPEKTPKLEQFETLFAVYKKNLNFTVELERRFGPFDVEDNVRRIKKNRPKEFLSDHITPIEGFVKGYGISMSKSHTSHGFDYYTYDHSHEYQNRHKVFLESDIFVLRNMMLEDPRLNTVEAEIEKVCLLFEMDQNIIGIKALEHLIARLQCAADPAFSISNRKCRLEYRVIENRPFHIAVLQYSHILSNRGCHRTALEVAKALLNLDRTDPLAVQLIIDTYAIRAGEYEWLVRAVDWFEQEKQGKYLYNLQFSKALALYHIAVKNNDTSSFNAADCQLKKALMLCPYMLDSIVKDGGSIPKESVRKILEHDFFNTKNVESKPLHQLTKLYASFLNTWWREQPVYEWLVTNAEQMLQVLQVSACYRQMGERWKTVRRIIFQGWPMEVYCHMTVIKPLSMFIVDGAVPHVPHCDLVYRFNPLKHPDGINRYNYKELDILSI